jgi:hypothetical protein
LFIEILATSDGRRPYSLIRKVEGEEEITVSLIKTLLNEYFTVFTTLLCSQMH